MEPPIQSNSISSLILNNLVRLGDDQGPYVPITLHRLTAPLDLVPPLLDIPDPSPTLILPQRTPVDLPPPGDASATLVLRDPAGDGATGQVYHVDIVDSNAEGYIPPLVIKIARPGRLGHIAREAWFYDELTILQGVCVPRCYGWFEAELPEGVSLPEEVLELDDDDTEDELTMDDWVTIWGPGIAARVKLRSRISLLLLERVGSRLDFNIPVPSTVRTDWIDLASDLCHLYVDHRDIRYPNFLQAPTGPSALPSLPSPRTGKIYHWRLVDLELCEKYKSEIPALISCNISWIGVIFFGIFDEEH